MKNRIKGHDVYGLRLHSRTECLHYHSKFDIIAIKFKCCGEYYACYSCHQALADHPAERWEYYEFSTNAFLCGQCGIELTVEQYLSCHHQCPSCGALFNPGCKKHWHLYCSSLKIRR